MKKYLYLQSKRAVRHLAGGICAAVVLLGALLGVFVLVMDQQSENNTKFTVAIAGDTDEPILQMGLSALDSFDITRHMLEFVMMDQESAKTALEEDRISAYVVVPEGFVENALNGQILPLEFVSKRDGKDLSTVFKKELTQMLSTILTESQRGSYGASAAQREEGISSASGVTTEAALEYMKLILARENMYTVSQWGVADGLDMTGTLLCGLTVLLIMLICLPFAPMIVRNDGALSSVLVSRKKPVWAQSLCDFLVYCVTLMIVLVTFLLIVWLVCRCGLGQWLTVEGIWVLLWRLLPVTFMAAGLSYLLYTVATELISGVLLQFFVTAALCFVSGCMYPISFFPESIQRLGAWLPSGTARTYLSCVFTDRPGGGYIGILLGECCLFLILATAIRYRKGKRGGA